MSDPNYRLRRALDSGNPSIGSWLQSGSAAAAEILANAGFDWLGLDCEHTSADIASVEAVARALHGRGASLLVRVSRGDVLEIRKCLDVGASGVIVPLVETVEQAELAVAAAKYPPMGQRGFCFGRMNDWGVAFAEHAKDANAQTVVIVMIESRRGVQNVREILATPGVDGAFIGPYDLSGSYGVPGELQHPDVLAACAEVLMACRELGKAAGQHLVRSEPEQIERALASGFTFLGIDADIIFLDRAARASLAVAERCLRHRVVNGARHRTELMARS